MRWSAFIALLLCVGSRSGTALADLPGPKLVCDADEKACTRCGRHMGNPDAGEFNGCVDAAKAKGLVQACRDTQGAGETLYFCPPGVTVPTKRVGGCGPCAAGGDPAGAGLALLLVASVAGVLVARRRALRPDRTA